MFEAMGYYAGMALLLAVAAEVLRGMLTQDGGALR